MKRSKEPFITVACQRCNNCLRKKANDKTFQIAVEEKNSQSAHFITLTYEDTELYKQTEGDMDAYPSVDKRDVQLFYKRLRKFQTKYHKEMKPIKYYTVSEYSPTNGRPHYHAIVFNLHPNVKSQISKIWAKGNVHTGAVSSASINYVTYYVFEKRENKPLNQYYQRENEFSLTSQNLGHAYLKNKKYHVDNKTFLAIVNGKTFSLPNYYKEKMFTKGQINSINKKYEAQTEIERQKEIQRLLKLGHKNPEYALESRLFKQQEKLTHTKKEKL